MSLYTMQIKDIINNPLTPIFNFDYPFYSDNEELKKEFEELFIMKFYFHEIGAETFARWQQMLKARLYLRMPYYRQLYQTEWHQMDIDMMLSKDLLETTTKKVSGLTNDISEQSTNVLGQSQSNQATSSSDTTHTINTSSGVSNGEGESEETYLSDGVASVEDDLTGKTRNQSNATSSGESEDNIESSGTTTSDLTSHSSQEMTGTTSNQQTNEIEETVSFHSKGNIGVQTPAYAIAEWRKVIINLNEMILNDLSDLFMLIY